jgi:hypothetical protein
MKLSLVILAAGLSTRYRGLKQLDAVGPNGEALLDYGIYDAVQSGFARFVFVIRPELEQLFRDHLRNRLAGSVACDFVHQRLEEIPDGFAVPANRDKPWGAGHALLMAEKVLAEPFAVCNADDFYGATAYALLHEQLRNIVVQQPPVFTMVGYGLRATLSSHGGVSRGVCLIDGEGYLEAVTEVRNIEELGGRITGTAESGEVRELDGGEIVSMSLWGFTPAFFPLLQDGFIRFLRECGEDPGREFLTGNVLNDAIGAGRVRIRVLRAEEPWFGVTFPMDRHRVAERIHELVARGRYPEDLSEWFKAITPTTGL